VLAQAEVKWAIYKAIDDLLSHIADGRHAESRRRVLRRRGRRHLRF
jgi:hypothetical protein